MKRKLLLILAVVLAVTLVAGCAQTTPSSQITSEQNSTTPAVTKDPNKKVTLEFWDACNPEETMNSIIEAFETANPNIKINKTFYGDPAFLEALTVAAASKTGPDLFFDFNGTQLYMFIDNGFAADLSSYAKQYK